MNGHESVVMAKMKEAKPSLINLKAMMCLIGSILMNVIKLISYIIHANQPIVSSICYRVAQNQSIEI